MSHTKCKCVFFSYTKGYDPDGWIEVDSETGKVTTTKTVDRESSFVNQSIYTVSIFAADDGMANWIIQNIYVITLVSIAYLSHL